MRASPHARSRSVRTLTLTALYILTLGSVAHADSPPEEPVLSDSSRATAASAPAAASAAPGQPHEPPVDGTPDTQLDGKQIYEKVLENRFDSYVQDISMQSGDRGGNTQDTEMQIKYRSFRKDSGKTLSKTIMKYQAPQDVRHLGYLVINKADGSEDQFVYRPSARRVQRINLRGEAVFGTDFAFEDIIPQELENASYERQADRDVDGTPVYVVEVTPVEAQDSDYSRFEVYVTRDHFVALRVVYWDRDELEIKKLTVVPESITLYEYEEDGGPKQIWVARHQKIEHLKLDTWTRLRITDLDPTVKLERRHFSQRELTSSH